MVQHIRKIKGTTGKSTINTFQAESGWTSHFISKIFKEALRAEVSSIGDDKLSFSIAQVGTHSLCSGGVMAMHLAKIPIYTIMIIDRMLSLDI